MDLGGISARLASDLRHIVDDERVIPLRDRDVIRRTERLVAQVVKADARDTARRGQLNLSPSDERLTHAPRRAPAGERFEPRVESCGCLLAERPEEGGARRSGQFRPIVAADRLELELVAVVFHDVREARLCGWHNDVSGRRTNSGAWCT